MDVPILTVVIGVTGTLMGTIVGGCLTTFTNILAQKRRERAEFRIGCRLVDGELGENHAVVIMLLQSRRWALPDLLEPGTEAWEKHQHVLASYLPFEAWCDLLHAVRVVHRVRYLWTTARESNAEEIDDFGVQLLTGALEEIVRGRTSLELLEPLPRLRPTVPGPPISTR
jgi:hypothetical protein